MAKPKVWWPLDYVYITGAWGNSPEYYAQYGQKGHNGIDLRAPVGTPVYAIADGTVLFEGWGQNHSWMGKVAGISIILKHAFGYTGYAHLKNTIINNGQKVVRGQLIGHSGATGGVTGAHLHTETLPVSPNFKNGFAGRVNPDTIVELRQRGTPDNPPLKPNERMVGKLKLNVRTLPDASSSIAQAQLAANTAYVVDGWTEGNPPAAGESNIWFKVGKGWAWASGFTSQSTDAIPFISLETEPETRIEEVVVIEPILFEVEVVETDELEPDEVREMHPGVVGERMLTYKVTFVDDVEVDRELVSELITPPVNRVIAVGVHPAPEPEPEPEPKPPANGGCITAIVAVVLVVAAVINIFIGGSSA